jgi:hypothetical protein
MMANPKRSGALVLRLIVGLALLGWPLTGSAAGTWSVISLPPKPGEVFSPTALATDAAGNLYIADGYWIQKRDARAKWSVVASTRAAPGQVIHPAGLAVDAAGNLYVADWDPSGNGGGRILKRDAQGSWSVIAAPGSALGQVNQSVALAVDAAGNLYVADGAYDSTVSGRIQKRDSQGNWTVIATGGTALGQVVQVYHQAALAVDAAGNLYVADSVSSNGRNDIVGRIQKRNVQGRWSMDVATGDGLGQVDDPSALSVDGAGNLYVADGVGYWGRIQKRDAQGRWSVIPSNAYLALAVDTAGNLYVTNSPFGDDPRSDEIQEWDAQGHWSVVATPGTWSLAVDSAGDLYVAEGGRIQKRDTQGNWADITPADGTALVQVVDPTALAVDPEGNLYVGESPTRVNDSVTSAIWKRDIQGNWSPMDDPVDGLVALAVDAAGNLYASDGDQIQRRDSQGSWVDIASPGDDPGQVLSAYSLAVDAAGALYVAGQYTSGDGRIQKRDTQGSWSEIDAAQVNYPSRLTVDRVGALYVADQDNNGNNRIQRRDAQGKWSVITTAGPVAVPVWLPNGGQYGVLLPNAIAVDGVCNLYVADPINHQLERYTPQP